MNERQATASSKPRKMTANGSCQGAAAAVSNQHTPMPIWVGDAATVASIGYRHELCRDFALILAVPVMQVVSMSFDQH